MTKKPVYVAKQLRDRRYQRALLQFFKPENYFEVRRALEEAGRQDLIGAGCDCLIPGQPPKDAIEARRRRANDPDHYHSIVSGALMFFSRAGVRTVAACSLYSHKAGDRAPPAQARVTKGNEK